MLNWFKYHLLQDQMVRLIHKRRKVEIYHTDCVSPQNYQGFLGMTVHIERWGIP